MALGPPDGRVDHARRRVEMTPREREVLAHCGARCQLSRQRRVCRLGAGHREEAGRPLVEAVHDARAGGVAHSGQVGEASEQALHECAATVAGSRMRHQPGGLVAHDDVLVGEHDCDVDLGIGLARLGLGERGQVDVDDLTRRHAPGTGGDRPAADLHGARRDEVGGCRAREAGDERDHPVDALAVEPRRDGLGGPCHARRQPVKTSNTPPQVMAASATLNVGHHPRRTKSTTPPAA